jgi:hypothetical protein
MKRATVEPGSIKVCATARGHAYPNVAGWMTIPAWSRGAKPWSDLSPFFMQSPDNPKGNFESYWQSWKVWEHVAAQNRPEWKWPAQIHVAADGQQPNELWQKWHDELANHHLAVRRPNGWAKPLYAWWKGQKLDVVEARKQIYLPGLQALYRAHPTYQKLLALVQSGQNVIIVEPDGPPIDVFPQGANVSANTLRVLLDVTKVGDFPGLTDKEREVLSYSKADEKYLPYGHGYVIALTILEDLPHTLEKKIKE